MNRKQLGILLLLVVLVGGLGLVVYQRNSASWRGSAAPAGKKVLGDFDLNAVARVVIKESGSTVTLLKKEDRWVVGERGDYPADFNKIKTLIQGLWELKPVQEMKVGPSQFARLELVAPGQGKEPASATVVEFKSKEDKPIAGLMLGKKFLRKSGHAPDEEGFPAGRYVMPLPEKSEGKPGEAKVSLVSETLETADAGPREWLDKTFLHIDRIRAVTLSGTTPALHWKLSREAESGSPASDWKLADAKPDEKVDGGKAPAFSSLLGAPRFVDVRAATAKADEGQGGQAAPTTVTVETFDGFTYTLRLGKPEDGNFPVTIAVSADLPKERTPGKEEKKKLDEEHAAKAKKLSEKLAKEKGFEGRVYLLSESSLAPLLKPRADLIASKPGPSPTPVPGALPETPAPPLPASSPAHPPEANQGGR